MGEIDLSPVDWCKNCGFLVKGTKVDTMIACYILNDIGYGPLPDSKSWAFQGGFYFFGLYVSL